MAYRPRAKPSRKEQLAAKLTERIEVHLTIPDALIAWAADPGRQVDWPAAYGQQVTEILARAKTATLSHDDLERLLSRLDFVVSMARSDGRNDLLEGFDLQTAEWLGLEFKLDTPRGPMHIGPDPATRSIADAPEPQWTFREVRTLFDAHEKEALDLAWRVKALIFKAFPHARITSLERDKPTRFCVTCGKPSGNVMVETLDGFEYHPKCWSQVTGSGPRLESTPSKTKQKR